MKTRLALIGVLAVCAILALSYSFSTYFSEGAFEDWRALGAPPHAIEEVAVVYFNAASDATIVTTTAGSDLLQQGALSLCSNAVCWEQVESIPATNDWSELTITALCEGDYKKIAPPPGAPIWCANFWDIAFGTHFVRQAHFAMLEDGDVWVWQFIPGQTAILIMIAGILAAGIIAVLVLFALLWIRAKERRAITVSDSG